MSTPTPGKHPLSQQGRTPSQHPHGVAATPPVSTPFSIAQAAFSPNGPRSSPQQVKKSPATATSATAGRSTGGAVNFDSPSATAALGALQMGPGELDLGLPSLGNLGKASEDERARRLDNVLAILNRSKGLVSEAGLERLAKKLELEFMWENSMTSNEKKTLIVAGSALELLVEFSNNIVQSVSLAFPDSAEIVNKHAESAGQILFTDLRLREGQSPLTKSLERFAANFERLAVLDKLSINPGLNLYEAVAGIYESLVRLHSWELQKAREDPALAGKSDEYLENLVLCTKSGKPTMNARGRVGMTLDYWKERRLQPTPTPDLAAWADEHEQTWSILIGCSPLREMIGISPVRISDKWIGPAVEKTPLPDELHASGTIIDWLEPESTFIPMSDQTKADPMQSAAAPLLGPRLPEVAFHATFDPPVHIPVSLWHQIQELGCVMDEPAQPKPLKLFDNLVIPLPPSPETDPPEMRIVTCKKKTVFALPGETRLSSRCHANTLHVYKPVFSRTLTGMTFSHPQQLVAVLPYLRQYVFLARLLENSFNPRPASVSSSSSTATTATTPSNQPSSTNSESKTTSTATTTKRSVTTTQEKYQSFVATPSGIATAAGQDGDRQANGREQERKRQQQGEEEEEDEDAKTPLAIDVTLLSTVPVPRLRVVFPLVGGRRTANVTVAVAENGAVRVEEQNIFLSCGEGEGEGEGGGEEKEEKGKEEKMDVDVDANGRDEEEKMKGTKEKEKKKKRGAEDVGRLLEAVEDLGKWAEFIRTRWA
ncbi:hypothetical protein VTK26DRAFT_7809 [Humicola hyalothermophila]